MTSWNNLDILRAFAVSIVVFAHLAMYTHYGSHSGWLGLSGVCLFFVHTSLVLMWSLERDPHTFRFYLRRAFRLYPLWLVVLAAVVLLHIPIAPPAAPNFGYIQPHPKELLANVALLMNLTPQGARLIGASWSLPVEAQMYLLLPFLFFFVRTEKMSLWGFLVLDLFAFVSVWSLLPWHATDVTLASAIPYFLPGVIAYSLSKRVRPTLPPWTFIVFLLSYVVLHARYGNLPLSAVFCLAVGVLLPFFRQITWTPLVRTAHYIAKYSYGIYLCHIPAICIGLYYLRHHGMAVRITGMLVAMVGLPVILFHAVEEPMIAWGKRLTQASSAPVQLREEDLELEPVP